MTIDRDNVEIEATLFGETISGSSEQDTAAYIGDNMFGVAHHDSDSGAIGYLMAAPVGELNDHVSWGYWEHDDGFYATGGLWAAGREAEAAAEHIDTVLAPGAGSHTYHGQVMGGGGDLVGDILLDEDNQLAITFNFSSGDVSGSMGFTTAHEVHEDQNWNFVIDGGFSGSSFSGVNLLQDGDAAGEMQGRFYGSDAQAVGGTFTVDHASLQGVFKGTRE